MSQIFHRSANTIARVSIFGAVFFVAGLLGLFAEVNRSPWMTQARVAREQPIQFSHEHHVAGNGIDCRYCHTSVEDSRVRRHPADQDVHELPLADLRQQPVPRAGARRASAPDTPLQWTRVHDLPDFVYFNHSIHVNKGVGCTTCHGQVDRMPLMWQEQSLQMEWCLDCHREPGAVRPAARAPCSASTTQPPPNQAELGKRLVARVSDSEAHELLDVPPMTSTTSCDEPGRSRAADRRRARVLAHARRAAPTIRRSASACTTSSRREVEAITDPVARRTFLKLMGASLALAGVTACTRQPAEKIVPYVRQPEEIVPGKPLFFATAMPLGGVATGLLVESHEGRPTKIEGNPLHPGSLGATDVFAQAAVLGLYDPDRVADADATSARSGRGRRSSARSARRSTRAAAAAGRRAPHPDRDRSARRRSPRRFAICSARFPSAQVAPVGSGQPRQRPRGRDGSRSASTSTRSTASTSADVILSLDADFLGCGPGIAPLRARLRRAPAARAGRPDEPAVRASRAMPTVDRRARRSPPAAAAERDRGARAAARGGRRRGGAAGAASGRGRRATRRVDRRRRQGSAGAPRREPRHRRRRPAAGRPRARARDQRRRSATSARRSSTPTRSRPRRSISCSRCAISSPT